MRFFTVRALIAAALVSVVVTIPFLPAAKNPPDIFFLEAELVTNVAAQMQVFYDDGAGFSEGTSATADIAPAPTPIRPRFALPSGSYRMLRIDPLNRPGTITLSSLRVLTPEGALFRELPLGRLQPVHQVDSLALRGNALEIVAREPNNDPILTLAFDPPMVVPNLWGEALLGTLPRAVPGFLVLAAVLFLLERAPRFRAAVARWIHLLVTRPRAGLAAVALAATMLSAYPIVFLGKSYVSPNLGTILLYDAYPTLPGYRSAEMADVKLSDVGAIMWQHVPFSMVQHRALRQGELPLWNRYNAAGVPLLAQGQSMFGDPLHFLVVLANGRAWAWDLKYLIAKWLFAFGLGLTVLALLREPTAEPTRSLALAATPDGRTDGSAAARLVVPALLVAFAAPFIGFFVYRINHPAFFSVCYAPWVLYCLVRIARAAGRREVALATAGLMVANLALMNSGTVKEAYMLLVCMNLSGACIILASGGTWRERLLKSAAIAWAGFLFVLLTAPIWSTFLSTLKSAYTGYNTASAFQIQPSLLLGLFDEIFYRPLMSDDRVFSPSLNFVLLLGLLYFLATLREHFSRRAVIALAVSSLVPLALAFGLISPRWIVRVPFLSNIAHLDNTFSCVLIVLWAVLAGIGFAAAGRRLGTPAGRGDLIVAGLLLGALVFGWIAFGQAQHRPILGPILTVNQPGEVLPVSRFIREYLTALLGASVVAGIAVRRCLVTARMSAVRVLVILLCLALFLWRHAMHGSGVGFAPYTPHPTDRVDFHARSDAVQFVRAQQRNEPGRGFGIRGNFFAGWTGVYGLETVHGPDALVNPWLRELAGASGIERLWDWRLYVEPHGVGDARPFLDALNVRYYLDLQSDQAVMGRSLKLLKTADLDVYESPTAWPRAFFTDRVGVYNEPAELIAQWKAAAGRPLAAVQQSDLASLPPPLRGDLAQRTVTAATDYRLTGNSTRFRVRSNGPGMVVLTEAFWPGDFVAEVDGRRAAIVRVNHAFKGVVLDAAGDHHVTFRYWPRNFSRNLMLSALGAVLLIASLVLVLRRRTGERFESAGSAPASADRLLSPEGATPGHSSSR